MIWGMVMNRRIIYQEQALYHNRQASGEQSQAISGRHLYAS